MAGRWTKTFSTVSTLFDVPPGVDQLPASRPLLPQNTVPSGAVTRRLRSLTRARAADGEPIGSV